MKKKVLALFLAVSMIAGLTACGTKNETPADSTSTPAATEAPAGTEAAAGTEEAAAPADVDISEPVTLRWYLCGNNVTDDAEVLAAANEYLGEKLNVTLEPIWGTWGDFDQNVTLALQGGDDVDIYFTSSWTADGYQQYADKGAWLRLDSEEDNLIEKYASDLWAQLPEALTGGVKVTGTEGYGVYAVPNYKDVATQNCWDVNVPLLEKYGYTLDDIKNTDYYGFEEILKTVKEGEGKEFYPLLVEGAVLERMVTGSDIVVGDVSAHNLMSLYLNTSDVSAEGPYGTQILNKFATEEYKKFVEKSREYFLAGYIDPAMGNAQQANDTRSAKQLTGDYLIGTQSYSYGFEVQESKARGFEVAYVPCTDPYLCTSSVQGGLMAISSGSKNPERAMMFLNLVNTDPYLMTLLNYGVEGVHYNKLDSGEIAFTEKRNDYMPWTNGMGNITLLPPQEGQGADFSQKFKAYYDAAKATPAVGFSFDPTSVQAEMGALANVAAEYELALSTGAVDPAEKLPEFLQKLEDNGMSKVIDEANAQLTAYMAEKGN